MIKETDLKVNIYETRDAMGKAAATEVIQKINELFLQQEMVNMIFAAAPSQNEFLKALAASDINWQRVNAFHMDEYVGLPSEAPQAFGAFLRNAIFDKISLRSVHFINGNANSVSQECERYAALLEQYPTDIVCMGIGENGHIAFNDPPVADFNDPELVKVVELDPECRQQQVNDGCFATTDDVPVNAITLTVPALMKSRFVYCMVPGASKAHAVFNTLTMNIGEAVPASVLRNHPQAIIYLDRQSSQFLQKTNKHS